MTADAWGISWLGAPRSTPGPAPQLRLRSSQHRPRGLPRAVCLNLAQPFSEAHKRHPEVNPEVQMARPGPPVLVITVSQVSQVCHRLTSSLQLGWRLPAPMVGKRQMQGGPAKPTRPMKLKPRGSRVGRDSQEPPGHNPPTPVPPHHLRCLHLHLRSPHHFSSPMDSNPEGNHREAGCHQSLIASSTSLPTVQTRVATNMPSTHSFCPQPWKTVWPPIAKACHVHSPLLHEHRLEGRAGQRSPRGPQAHSELQPRAERRHTL